MTTRETNLQPDTPFDVLRRRAVTAPDTAGTYGRLASQHYGAFPAARLRPMLRWVKVLSGDSATGRHFDAVFARIEKCYANRSAILAVRPGSSHAIRVAGRTIRFVTDDPAADRFIRLNLIKQWPYEPGLLRYLMRRLCRDDVLVDVGAHAGYVSLVATVALDAVAYAIEPQRDLIRVIERNAAINGADRLHPLTVAVADRDGLTSMTRLVGSPGMQTHGELNRSGQPTPQHRHVDWIPMVRLDTLFAGDVLRPRIVKIDVEGLELRALAGAAGLIGRAETAFVVELHPHLISGFGGDLTVLTAYFGSPAWRVLDVSDDPPRPVALADGIARAAAGTREQDGRVTLAFEPAGWDPF